MKAVIQRVDRACVRVDGETVGEITRPGLLALVGATHDDGPAQVATVARKIALLANCRHGNRPDFLASAKPGEAKRLYEYFTAQVKKTVSHVDSGVFGAHMEVSLLNNGPVTILLDTEELKKK